MYLFNFTNKLLHHAGNMSGSFVSRLTLDHYWNESELWQSLHCYRQTSQNLFSAIKLSNRMDRTLIRLNQRIGHPINYLQFRELQFSLQGVPKKMVILSGFEFLTMGEVFLEVTFHQKTFLFYKFFWVSKQNFEKMAFLYWKIVKIMTSKWFFQLQNQVKHVKMS